MARTDSPTFNENALQPLLPGDMMRLPFDQAYTAAARSHFADYRSRRAEQTLRRQEADLLRCQPEKRRTGPQRAFCPRLPSFLGNISGAQRHRSAGITSKTMRWNKTTRLK